MMGLLTAVTTAVGTLSAAPPPEVLGIYVGNVSTITISAAGKEKTKSTMIVEVGTDNTTTVTIGGVEQQVAGPTGADYEASSGIFTYGPIPTPPLTGSGLALNTVTIKNGKMKGTGVGFITEAGPPATVALTFTTKFKLKK